MDFGVRRYYIDYYLSLKPIPAKYLAKPPYRAELFSEQSGWSGVMNKQGINCLTYELFKGGVIANIFTCNYLARLWNKEK